MSNYYIITIAENKVDENYIPILAGMHEMKLKTKNGDIIQINNPTQNMLWVKHRELS